MATYQDLLQETRQQIKNIDLREADRLRREGAILVDIREADEVEQGIVDGAVHIPRGFLESRIEQVATDKSAPLVVYCAGGARSVFGTKALEQLGYTDVASMDGGFNAWKTAALPWSKPASFTQDQRRRYSRHFLLPEVGEAGQQKLLNTKVLLIGAGGLGSPAALYLAAAGIGTLGIIDDDIVDDSNLQRQVAHTTDRIGMPKVESARIAIEALNPDVNVITYQTRLDKENILDIFADYDIILDGTDNFSTRYLINDACVLLGKPNVHGSIFRFEGQATVFDPPDGPCYRCIFPDPPPPDLAPNCAEGGVLGVLPGIDRSHPGDRGAQARARHRHFPLRPVADVRRAGRGIPRADPRPRPELPHVRRAWSHDPRRHRIHRGRLLRPGSGGSCRVVPSVD